MLARCQHDAAPLVASLRLTPPLPPAPLPPQAPYWTSCFRRCWRRCRWAATRLRRRLCPSCFHTSPDSRLCRWVWCLGPFCVLLFPSSVSCCLFAPSPPCLPHVDTISLERLESGSMQPLWPACMAHALGTACWCWPARGACMLHTCPPGVHFIAWLHGIAWHSMAQHGIA